MFLKVTEKVKFRIFGITYKTVVKQQSFPMVKDQPVSVFDKQGVSLTVELSDKAV